MPSTPRTRLDVRLVNEGLAASRERARALILAGRVKVGGEVVSKAGANVPDGAAIEVVEPDFPWVGRGGVKLAHALDTFGIDVTGREALDIGASTGGFTDVLLQRGARRVVALDVGHGQLDWRLREDPRVVVLERRNARQLERGWLPAPVDVVTIDVSFISLRLILPALPPVLAPGADIVALVKPQFEAGRRRGGPRRAREGSGDARRRAGARDGERRVLRSRARGHDAVPHHRRDREPGVPAAPAAGLTSGGGGLPLLQ